MTPHSTTLMHASAVAVGRQAVLIRGKAGSGKSGLALELMALGAVLVSDDQTWLHRDGDAVVASAPKQIRGMIEARGVGLLAADTVAAARVALVVDLDHAEAERLPPLRHTTLLGCRITLLQNAEHVHFPAAILQYLKGGRCA